MYKWQRVLCCLLALLVCFSSVSVPALAYNTDTDDTIYFIDVNGNVVFSVPSSDFNNDDYIIPYDLYLELKDNPISTYNVATGVLGFSGGLAWSSSFAEIGAICSSGGLYLLGILALGGGIAYGVDGLVDMYRNGEFEQFYKDVCTLYAIASDSTKQWLEEAFEAYVAGEAVSIPVSVSQDIASALNANAGFFTDSEGNVINTSLSIPDSFIGGVYADTYPSSAESNMGMVLGLPATEYYLFEMEQRRNGVTTSFTENDYLSWYAEAKTADGTALSVLTNKITGTSLTFDLSTIHINYQDFKSSMTDFFLVQCANGATFWYTYFGEGFNYTTYNGKGTLAGYKAGLAPSNVTSDYPIVINGSGTVLDGQTISSVVWDSVAAAFAYTVIGGNTYHLPVDPLGLVISNTGTGVAVDIPYNPNKDNKNPVLPPFSCAPFDGDVSVGVPTSSTYMDDVASGEFADSGTVEGDSPSGILSGIIDWITEGVINALKACFIPREGFFSDFFADLESSFSDRFGILTYPVSIIYRIFDSFMDLGSVEPVLSWGSWSYKGTEVIPAGSYNLNDMLENDTVKRIYDIYLIIVDCCLIFLFLKFIEKKYHSVISN